MKVTIFVTTFNHDTYVDEFLDSLGREFNNGTQIVIADLGSQDKTLEVIKKHVLYREGRISLNVYPKGTSTLEALFIELPKVETDYILGMSGDDVFDCGFGQAIQNFKNFNTGEKVMLNMTLVHTDKNLIPFREQKPRWVQNNRINRLKLSFGNPGTGPGAVYPAKELISVLKGQDLHGLLIEDYFIYWHLVDSVKFINLPSAKVLYRRHPDALTKQNSNSDYLRSIGYLVGLSFDKSRNPLEGILSLLLFFRWIRHIPINKLRYFMSGIRSGYGH